ncbi:MAG: isoprenylcysteine carboxylmethyltransferase family protein [Thermodesulfobacteriota bacterium]|nr:isoprenylcysteine carboxylmethyltransferase family protein [Thermodesulfobacteriota bacterium]
MEEKMSRWGIGPTFTALSIGYGILAIAISRYFYPVFRISFLPPWVLNTLGIALMAVGIPFFLVSVKSVSQAYNSDKLVTGGVYKCCRHPLYGSWMVFIVPGVVLLLKSWIGLTTPLFMYLILRNLVKKEEDYLESVFGSEYGKYKKKVPSIMPYGWIKPLL